MTIDRWASMSGSTSPRPQVASGTKCLPCSARGHHCDAHEVVDGRAVCLHCLDGVDCPRTPRGGPFRSTGPLRPTRPAPQGAEPNAAMPARRAEANGPERREKIKRLLLEGKSASVIAGMVGVSCQTVYNVRKGIEELNGKTPVGIRALHARKPDAVPNVVVATKVVENAAENVAVESVELEEKVAAKSVEVAQVQPALSEKCAAEGYKVVTLAELPGRKRVGVYDEIAAEFMKLPKRTVLTKTFHNSDIAHTWMLALVRIGRKHGLRVSQKQDGNTIYVWQV